MYISATGLLQAPKNESPSLLSKDGKNIIHLINLPKPAHDFHGQIVVVSGTLKIKGALATLDVIGIQVFPN